MAVSALGAAPPPAAASPIDDRDGVAARIDDTSIAYVAGSKPPSKRDLAKIRYLRFAGADVRVVDDDDATSTDYSEDDLVFVSTSVALRKVLDHFDTLPIPLITDEHHLTDDMSMARRPIGLVRTDSITIAEPTSPLAAGLSGDVVLTSIETPIGFATVGRGATVVGTVGADLPAYFAYDTGDQMVGALAPAPRVYFPGTTATASVAKRSYLSLLDAAVNFALGRSTPPVNVAPNAVEDRFATAQDAVLYDLDLLANDTDANDDPLAISVAFDSTYGARVSVDAAGLVSYDPTESRRLRELRSGDTATDVFRYTVVDPGGLTGSALVWVTVTGVDEPPTAGDDSYTTDADQVLTASGQDVVGRRGVNPGRLRFPEGIEAGPGGEMFIADTGSNRIQICDRKLNCDVIGGPGSAPGQFAEPAGLALDAAGRIVVADTGNDRIQICERSGSCDGYGTSGGNPGQFSDPTDVAVAHDGSIIVADSGNGRIQICDPILVDCSAIAGFTNDFFTNLSVAVTPNGNVLVTDGPSVNVCERSGACTAAPNVSGFGDIAGVAVAANGDVVLATPDSRSIVRCRADFSVCDEQFRFGIGDQFEDVRAVAVDDQGDLFAIATDFHRVHIGSRDHVLQNDTDINFDRLTVVGFDATSALGAAVTIAEDGSLAYDPTTSAILQALPRGEQIDDTFTYEVANSTGRSATGTVTVRVDGKFGSNRPPVAVDDSYDVFADTVLRASGITAAGSGLFLGNFSIPESVAVRGDGTVAVINNDRLAFIICEPTGRNCSAHFLEGSFPQPSDLAAAPDGSVVVAVRNHNVIQVCNLVDTCAVIGGPGTAPGRFTSPDGVAVDSNGTIIVADTGNDRIQLCDTSGTCTAFGRSGTEPGHFKRPRSVAVDPSGNIIVADTANQRVQRCDRAGTCDVVAVGAVARPTAVVVDRLGNIYVADEVNHRLAVCDPQDVCSVIADVRGSELGQTDRPSDIAIDRSGNLVVADTSNGRLQTFSPDRPAANDSDADGDRIGVVDFDPVSELGAAVSFGLDGALVYDPMVSTTLSNLVAGSTVVDTFTYTIEDEQGEPATATISITVTGTAPPSG